VKESANLQKMRELNKRVKGLDAVTLFVIEDTLIEDFVDNPEVITNKRLAEEEAKEQARLKEQAKIQAAKNKKASNIDFHP